MTKTENHIQLKDAFKTFFEPNVVSFYNGILFKVASFIFNFTNTINAASFVEQPVKPKLFARAKLGGCSLRALTII